MKIPKPKAYTAEERSAINRGAVSWFARNPVAANLLMLFIVFAGIFSAINIPRTLTPDFDINWVQISLTYPGATPEEVEHSLVVKVEEALREVTGIKQVVSRSYASQATISVEVDPDYKTSEVQAEIRGVVDGVPSFPEGAEKPVVSRAPTLRHVVSVEISGDDLSYRDMFNLADEIKLELLALPKISKVEIYGQADSEISIEVDENILKKYNITIEDVAYAVRRSALDLPGGSIRTDNGNILLHTKGRSYRQKDFELIPVLSFADGSSINIGDVATVRDGFVEGEFISRLNGRNSVGLAPQAYNNQDMMTIAGIARDYVDQKKTTLPPGVYLDTWSDVSDYLGGRINMMLKNLLLGSLFVFLVLILFIDIKLAFWVMMGIPISFCGAFALMPLEPFAVTINMLSLFALIMVLGIVVDDAIIVGESAYSECEKRGHSIDSVISGTHRILVPSIFGVLTTVIAFAPTIFVTGAFAAFPNEIGFVVILCLAFSLIESKLILPAHLAHTKPSTAAWLEPLRSLQRYCNHLLQNYVIKGFYRPFLRKCIEFRYTTIAGFIAVLILFVGLLGGGVIRVVLTDSPPGDFLQSSITMVRSAPNKQLIEHMKYMESQIIELDKEYIANSGTGFLQYVNMWSTDGLDGRMFVELLPQEERSIKATDIMRQWRDKVGALPGTKVLSYSNAEASEEFAAISMVVSGDNYAALEIAALDVFDALEHYQGVYDVRSDVSDKRDELHIQLKPVAKNLGLDLTTVGNQVRHAFYGYEAQRIQRGSKEIKVMVRYPRDKRDNVTTLQNMSIRTANGGFVPFSSVAYIKTEPSVAERVRVNGRSAIQITAEIDKDLVSAGEVVDTILAQKVDIFKKKYGVTLERSAGSESEAELINFLILGFMLAMLANYCFIAMPLRSYAQPAIVMGAVPFCMIGALIGHLIVDIPLSILSLFGVVAASGVVVNDGLILADYINKMRAQGMNVVDAVIESGSHRYRAIMLTSLTTFFGLLPIMLEKTAQAVYVIPMAISLSYGVLFATVVTLFFLPCMYVAIEDPKRLWQRYIAAKNIDTTAVAKT